MAAYDARRRAPSRALTEQTLEVMGRFLRCMSTQDVAGMEALLAADVVTLNDTNGRYPAAWVPVVGANKVARFHAGIADLRRQQLPRIEVRSLNGTPAVVCSYDPPVTDRFAPAFITIGELDEPAIRRIYRCWLPDKSSRLPRHPIGYSRSRVTASHALRTSGESFTSAALSVSSSWSARVAPMIVEPTKSCASDQAIASVTTDMPASAAIFAKRSVEPSVFSFTKRRVMTAPRAASFLYCEKRAPSGNSPPEYLPESTPPASGLYGSRLSFSRRHTFASSSSKRRFSSEKLFWIVS
jgi:hypothetical protein